MIQHSIVCDSTCCDNRCSLPIGIIIRVHTIIKCQFHRIMRAYTDRIRYFQTKVVVYVLRKPAFVSFLISRQFYLVKSQQLNMPLVRCMLGNYLASSNQRLSKHMHNVCIIVLIIIVDVALTSDLTTLCHHNVTLYHAPHL